MVTPSKQHCRQIAAIIITGNWNLSPYHFDGLADAGGRGGAAGVMVWRDKAGRKIFVNCPGR